jgi:hypothetical protein
LRFAVCGKKPGNFLMLRGGMINHSPHFAKGGYGPIYTKMPANGGTGFQPVPAPAKACGYKNIPLIATWY